MAADERDASDTATAAMWWPRLEAEGIDARECRKPQVRKNSREGVNVRNSAEHRCGRAASRS